MAKFNQKQAAEFLGIPERSVESYRLRGGGPPYYKIGARVVYDEADLAAWLAARRCTSTSDRRRVVRAQLTTDAAVGVLIADDPRSKESR